ncbi:hypothetical protein DFP92_11948 [Yoonia sediminilitoris]|uniref:Uncharacterized protein n=1 Tax=Yoonia sediminilitoris TaxID=1286148 RepID=A0A2T6K6X0_9RHOB|nr:hypothetical protein C8N45_11948 [Yoonia sediminilitoris]RCW89887.1 hypothetical protein DFP92_11948 [Yoonia sediminilitoris]
MANLCSDVGAAVEATYTLRRRLEILVPPELNRKSPALIDGI